MKKIIYLLALTILIGGAILISGTTIAQTKPIIVNMKDAQGGNTSAPPCFLPARTA